MGKNVGKERPSFITDLVENNTHTYNQNPTYNHTDEVVVKKERRSRKMNLLFEPSLAARFKEYSNQTGISMNDIVCKLVDDFLKEKNM